MKSKGAFADACEIVLGPIVDECFLQMKLQLLEAILNDTPITSQELLSNLDPISEIVEEGRKLFS